MGIDSVPGRVRRLEPPMLEIDREALRRAPIARCCNSILFNGTRHGESSSQRQPTRSEKISVTIVCAPIVISL